MRIVIAVFIIGVGFIFTMGVAWILWAFLRPSEVNKDTSYYYLEGVKCFNNNNMQGTIDNLTMYFDLGGSNPVCHEHLSSAYSKKNSMIRQRHMLKWL